MTLSALLKMENKQHVSKDFITRLKGEYQAKYGFDMDEWTAIMLYEMTERFTGFYGIIDESKVEIDKAVQQINGQLTPIHFKDEKEAFKYGLGKTIGNTIAIALTVCFVSFLAFWLIYTSQKYEDKLRIVNEYKNIQQYRILSQNGKIIEQSGKKYLVLNSSAKKGTVKIGEEYEEGDKKNEIWVLLGR